MCAIDTLAKRRQDRLKSFSIKCTKDKFNSKMFPRNRNPHNRDKFIVNFARTNKYQKSAVPQCQRLLNKLASNNHKAN